MFSSNNSSKGAPLELEMFLDFSLSTVIASDRETGFLLELDLYVDEAGNTHTTYRTTKSAGQHGDSVPSLEQAIRIFNISVAGYKTRKLREDKRKINRINKQNLTIEHEH